MVASPTTVPISSRSARTVFDENGNSTLVENIFFNLSLEENTYGVPFEAVLRDAAPEMKMNLARSYLEQYKEMFLHHLELCSKVPE